ncbi:hypothetical protein C5B96_02715 [Subtercola sp. Z020]|uniref:hypothetical protein n=1 Tax=Subtercola sp. Z020 TaxID=2080582 RepID=UPI000CE877A1|nr:hypothetical protein [Subtercola sp. Z020]PPF88425.1 hypothetical protein C5B96_02715 [Subtercola sp. Z020]
MTSDWLGGGLIVALAAVLWLIYLIPTWFRRNEFLSTERNVVRLQQTLRILAETSEVPDEVHVEANARSVAEQQRILKKANAQNLLAERAGLQTLIEQGIAAQQATAAAAEREAELRARALESAAQGSAGGVDPEATAFRVASDESTPETGDYETIVLAPTPSAPTHRQAVLKLRRARAATSGVLLLALVVSVLGGVQIAVNGAWVVLVVGLLAATLCVTRLARLARDGRALSLSRPLSGARRSRGTGAAVSGLRPAGSIPSEEFWSADELAAAVADEVAHEESETVVAAAAAAAAARRDDAGDGSGWMPVPLPKPLHVGHRRIEGDVPVPSYIEQTAVQAEQALRAAARDSEQALRASQAAGVPDTAPDAATAAEQPAEVELPSVQPVPNRFAAMGVVDDASTGALDVDRILARRRAG